MSVILPSWPSTVMSVSGTMTSVWRSPWSERIDRDFFETLETLPMRTWSLAWPFRSLSLPVPDIVPEEPMVPLDDPDIVPEPVPEVVESWPADEPVVLSEPIAPLPAALWPVSPEVASCVEVLPSASGAVEPDALEPVPEAVVSLEPVLELAEESELIVPLAGAPVPLAVAWPVSPDAEPVPEVVPDVEVSLDVEPLAVAPGAVAVPVAEPSPETEPLAVASEEVEPVVVPDGVPVEALALPEAVVSVDAGADAPGCPAWAVAVSLPVWALDVRSDFELVAQARPAASGRTSAILRICICHSSMWCANLRRVNGGRAPASRCERSTSDRGPRLHVPKYVDERRGRRESASVRQPCRRTKGDRAREHPRAGDGEGRLRAMRRRLVVVVPALLLALLSVVACRKPEGPADRYRVFTAAARAGDANTVWQMLSEESRAALDARAKDLAARAAPGVVPESGRELVLGGLAAQAPKVESVVVLRESRDRAVLAVKTAGGGEAQEVTLVREDGSWRVVLPPAAARPAGG